MAKSILNYNSRYNVLFSRTLHQTLECLNLVLKAKITIKLYDICVPNSITPKFVWESAFQYSSWVEE